MNRDVLRLTSVALLVLGVTSMALAEIPPVISYQGKVTDTLGNPVADGWYTMRFRIYDAATGGTMLWDSGDCSPWVSGGVFSLLLGESPHPALGLDFNTDYWLEVTIGGDVQSPRQRLASVGYSYMASGLVAGTSIVGSVEGGTYAALKVVNTAPSSYTTYGVYGMSSSTIATGSNFGVFGETSCSNGRAVGGNSYATSGTTYGGRFSSGSTSGTGVYASTVATTGVTYGVYGKVYSPSGYGVYYSGGLAGTGTKSCVVKTSQGPTLMYCQESPENWFEDFGEGQLINGRCHIELDPLFLETVTVDAANPMKVFVELNDERCKGVAVKKGTAGFDVVELWSGTSNAAFDYRVVAKRKGVEDKRLDYCEAAETDSYLYPELRENELREREEEHAHMEEERRLRNVE